MHQYIISKKFYFLKQFFTFFICFFSKNKWLEKVSGISFFNFFSSSIFSDLKGDKVSFLSLPIYK